jgi:hypothetical protein
MKSNNSTSTTSTNSTASKIAFGFLIAQFAAAWAFVAIAIA